MPPKTNFLMKKYVVFALFVCFHVSISAQQKSESEISFESYSFANNNYYLAGYYGKYTVLLDSAKASASGRVVFKKDKKYTEGIYLLVDNEKSIVMEFMMDDTQQFSIKKALNETDLNKVNNSKTNQYFFDFNFFLKNKMLALKAFQESLAIQKTAKDSLAVKENMLAINAAIKQHKNDYINNSPTSVLALFFKLSQPLDSFFDFENAIIPLKNRQDSLSYAKNNFIKDLDFSDSRMLRSPFLENKIDTYFTTFVDAVTDEITKEVFYILDQTGSKENEMFSYLSLYFVNKYADPKIMGLDRVFINIYNKYFLNKTYSWLTEKQKLSLGFSYKYIKDNLIGNKAPNLFMTSLNGANNNLYDVKATYLALIFWDPNCGHCTTELPKIKKMYEEVWKQKNIKVYAVNINKDMEKDWKDFIEKEQLQDWIHVQPSTVVYGNYSKEEVDFQTLYNVFQTPVLYLLDAEKTIIAKKIGFEKYVDIIENQKLIKK